MNTAIAAYLAGIIDADGTIGIKRSTYAMRVIKDSKQATFSERVCVKQVTPEAIDLLKKHFGGSRYISQAPTKRGKPLHVWQVTDKQAINCLNAIMEHLLIKKKQAQNCMALRKIKETSKKDRVALGRGHVGASSRSPEISAEMEKLYNRAKALNSTGV